MEEQVTQELALEMASVWVGTIWKYHASVSGGTGSFSKNINSSFSKAFQLLS